MERMEWSTFLVPFAESFERLVWTFLKMAETLGCHLVPRTMAEKCLSVANLLPLQGAASTQSM